MRTTRLIAAAAALSLAVVGGALAPDSAEACLHPLKEFKFPIKAGAQRGLIFFDAGHEELVLRPSYSLDTSSAGKEVKDDAIKGFNSLAWLVPLPSLPESYKEADKLIFTELEDFTPAYQKSPKNSWRGRAKGELRGGDEADGVEYFEKIKIGDYTIQPIKAKGEMGEVELNNWLETNGFGKITEETLKYYIDKDYYWLAIKLSNKEGLPVKGDVKPLQISFKTEKPVYPLKINSGRGEFDMELWVITRKELDLKKSKAFGLKTVEQAKKGYIQKNRQTRFSRLPKTVKAVAQEVSALKKMKAGTLYCYRFFGTGMDKTTDLSKLADDLAFEFKAIKKPDAKPTKGKK